MSDINIRPLGDRVVVEPIEQETTTASGLVLPESAKEKPQQGLVLAAGKGRWDDEGENRIPLDVKKATKCCSPNTQAPKSNSMIKRCSS
jgi:chaperonin GroES